MAEDREIKDSKFDMIDPGTWNAFVENQRIIREGGERVGVQTTETDIFGDERTRDTYDDPDRGDVTEKTERLPRHGDLQRLGDPLGLMDEDHQVRRDEDGRILMQAVHGGRAEDTVRYDYSEPQQPLFSGGSGHARHSASYEASREGPGTVWFIRFILIMQAIAWCLMYFGSSMQASSGTTSGLEAIFLALIGSLMLMVGTIMGLPLYIPEVLTGIDFTPSIGFSGFN